MSSLNFRSRYGLRAFSVAIAMAVVMGVAMMAGSTLEAQQPVVFVHGLASNGATWNEAAARVSQELDVQASQPSQSWWAPYQQQGAELQTNPAVGGLPPWTIAFGHSNGGVVSREWSKWHSLAGIATIGTPHQGAAIVNHIYDWLRFSDSAQLYDTGIVTSFDSPHNGHLRWVLNAVLGDGLAWARWFRTYVSYQSLLVAGLDFGVPVLNQMQIGSAYLQDLNSPPNLSREAAIPYRVGVVNVPQNFWFGGPLRLMIQPEYADVVAIALHTAAAGLFYYGSYVQGNADTSDPFGLLDAGEKANWMMQMGWWINDIDLTWCSAVSSPAPISGGLCYPNDSLVTSQSQFYPGAMNVGFEGASHTFETRYSGDAIYWVLRYAMGVQPPYVPPPPPPTDPPPGPPSAGNVLAPYEALYADQSRSSDDGRFTLYYQGDGNLVAVRDGQFPIWATGTTGAPGAVTMQGDGNLVITDGDGNCVWTSNTWGNDGAYLVVQGDGNIVIYRPDGIPIWATGTNGS